MAVTLDLTEEATSHFIQAGDIRMHYNEAGSGEAVICIHGGGPGASGWSNYNRNIAALSQRFRVLLVDMPGFGKSDAVVIKGESRPEYNAKAFKNFLDALGIEKAHFVGNSMGGATSVCFAVNNPDRIGKLILMGAAGGGVSIFQPNPPEGIKLLSQVYKSMTRETMRRLIEVFVYDSSFLTEELLEQRFQTASNPELTQAYLASTQGAPDLTAIAHKITAPTLIVYGRDDRVVPLDNMLRYLWTIPNARLHVFSQCGHWAQYEKAEEFNRLVEDFLTH